MKPYRVGKGNPPSGWEKMFRLDGASNRQGESHLRKGGAKYHLWGVEKSVTRRRRNCKRLAKKASPRGETECCFLSLRGKAIGMGGTFLCDQVQFTAGGGERVGGGGGERKKFLMTGNFASRQKEGNPEKARSTRTWRRKNFSEGGYRGRFSSRKKQNSADGKGDKGGVG